MRDRFVMMVLFLGGWISLANAQPATLDKPVKLRVTGTMMQAENPQREDLVVVNILVEDTPMLLRVGKVEELSATEKTQVVKWGVLLRQVRFYGPDALISQLRGAEAVGKVFMIDGELNTRTRSFLVSNVQAAAATKPQAAE